MPTRSEARTFRAGKRAGSTLLLALMFASGCGSRSEPAAETRFEPEQARVALIATLDAWKAGKTATLAKRVPPIRFVDDDHFAGMRLADYEIEEPDAPIALHKNVAVILSLRDKGGKNIRREANYQVGTEPTLAVLRSDP